MRELTIPDSLYEVLKAQALQRGRSVDEYAQILIESAFPPREEEMRRLREVMNDSLEPMDTEALPEVIRPRELPIDHVALRASMPELDPPTSETIIDDRSERV
jgi:hypothetical protein